MIKFVFLTLIWVQGAVAQPLAIQGNELWKAMLQQWFIHKATNDLQPHQKITLASPLLRIDLSMQDLIDQTVRILENEFGGTDYLQQLNAIQDPIIDFDLWYSKLHELAEKDSSLRKELDRHLVLQEYDADGVALTDGIPMMRLKRIHFIEKYNKIATDPEGPGILERLGNTKALTVASINQLSKTEIENATREQYAYYQSEMLRLERLDRTRYGHDTRYYPVLHFPRKLGNPMHVSMKIERTVDREEDTQSIREERFFKHIFNALEKLPTKHRFINAIDHEMGGTLTRMSDGTPVLTPSFLQEFEPKLTVVIKDLTWREQLSEQDDETLYQFRKWLKHHRGEVATTLADFNNKNGTTLELSWLQDRGMPHRSDVIESYEILRTIYQGDEPWQDEITTVMRNRRGKEVVLGRSHVGTIIRKAGIAMRNLVKYENLSGLAAGTGAFFLSGGNLAIAIAANSTVHDVVANRKYDHSPRELLTQIPMDLASGLLFQTSVQPGRLFNVIAYGAGSGMFQGLFTKQDPIKSALVGAGVELAGQLVPAQVRFPLANGLSRGALIQNGAMEIFTTSAKATLRGGIVATLEKKDVVQGMEKGAIYGASLAVLKIVVLGVRYNPTHGFSSSEVNTTLNEENLYDNQNAPGGNYQITGNTVSNTPFRTKGWLTTKIDGSITLPGSVSIHPEHMGDLEVVAHEAHHLSQQEQFGLLRFYYQYLLEATKVPYEDLSFEISAF